MGKKKNTRKKMLESLKKKAKRMGVEFIDLDGVRIQVETAEIIPEEIARRHHCICIDQKKSLIKVVMADPCSSFALEDLYKYTELQTTAYLGDPELIEMAINMIYGEKKIADMEAGSQGKPAKPVKSVIVLDNRPFDKEKKKKKDEKKGFFEKILSLPTKSKDKDKDKEKKESKTEETEPKPKNKVKEEIPKETPEPETETEQVSRENPPEEKVQEEVSTATVEMEIPEFEREPLGSGPKQPSHHIDLTPEPAAKPKYIKADSKKDEGTEKIDYRDAHRRPLDPDEKQSLEEIAEKALLEFYSDIPHWEADTFTHKIDYREDVIPESKVRGLPPVQEKSEVFKTSEILIPQEDPVVKLMEMLFTRALEEKASYVHIEPGRKEALLRLRVERELKKQMSLPNPLYVELLNRLKSLAGMDVNVRLHAQEGSFRQTVDGKNVIFLASTFPSLYGENITLKLSFSEKDEKLPDFKALGMNDDCVEMYQNMLSEPSGIILITGPIRSGKSTTLYSTLQHLRDSSRKIITVEERIEQFIDDVIQSHFDGNNEEDRRKKLVQSLRQDPDVIMTGNIPDKETAALCVEAAFTGRLVIAGIYSNDSVKAVRHLLDLLPDPSSLSFSLLGVISQRLVRRVCMKCAVEIKPDADIINIYETYGVPSKEVALFQGRGCKVCRGTGYSGRLGLFELLKASDDFCELLTKDPSIPDLISQLKKDGIITIFEDGLIKAIRGETTWEEINRAAAW